ncbi:MAG: recombinase family protein [Candidatus Thorarchaeota archaeon]|jgi:DNA invertase Pin-like site-specific DNA recombinase
MSLPKAIGYIRVSTREQAESGLSLSAQERRIQEFANYKQLDLVEIIKDEDVSASVPLAEREGGKRLFDIAKGSNISIIATKLDRLFRDAHDCLGVTKLWTQNGNALHLMDLGVDTTTAMGRAFLTNAATYAELERNLISERTKEALLQIKMEGGTLGAPSYGWSKTEEVDAHGRRVLKPNTDEIQVAVMCKAWREEGFTYKQIADRLNRNHVPSKRGGKWYASSVRNCCLRKI